MRISTKLLLPILSVTFAGLLCATLITYNMSSKALEDSSAASQKMAIANAMQELDAQNEFNVMNAISLAQTGLLQPFLSGDPELRKANEASAQARIVNMRNTYRYVMLGILTPDGMCIKHTEPDLVGKSFAHEDFFKTAMTGKVAIGNPFNYGNTVVYPVASPVVDAQKTIIGVVFNVSRLTDTMSKRMLLGDKGHILIATSDGLVFIDKNPNAILKLNIKDTPWGAAMLRAKRGQMSFKEGGEDGAERIAYYDTLEGPDWLAVAIVDLQEVLAPVTTIRNNSLGIAGGLLLAIAALVYFSVRRVVNALHVGRDFANTVASGDFNARWLTKGKDEVAELAQQLNTAFEKVTEQARWYVNILDSLPNPIFVTDNEMRWTFLNVSALNILGKKREDALGRKCTEWGAPICGTEDCGITCLKRTSANVAQTNFSAGNSTFSVTCSYIQNSRHETIGHIELVTDITEQETLKREAAGAALQGRLEAANQLEAVVDVMSAATAHLSVQVEQSERGAAITSERITETATAMEEMNVTVLEVARSAGGASDVSNNAKAKAEHGAHIVEDVVNCINDVERQSLQLKEDMVQLGEQAEAIGTIMNVISDIADQTNLLALNAAIEAARAGEAGRGFAVVADEVRKLAEKTMQATVEVGSAIKGVQQSADKNMKSVDASRQNIVQATELVRQAGEALKEIVLLVERSADQVRTIATAAEEQSSTSEEINHSLGTVSNASSDTARAMAEAAQAVSDLSQQAQNLVRLIENMKQ